MILIEKDGRRRRVLVVRRNDILLTGELSLGDEFDAVLVRKPERASLVHA